MFHSGASGRNTRHTTSCTCHKCRHRIHCRLFVLRGANPAHRHERGSTGSGQSPHQTTRPVRPCQLPHKKTGNWRVRSVRTDFSGAVRVIRPAPESRDRPVRAVSRLPTAAAHHHAHAKNRRPPARIQCHRRGRGFVPHPRLHAASHRGETFPCRRRLRALERFAVATISGIHRPAELKYQNRSCFSCSQDLTAHQVANFRGAGSRAATTWDDIVY